MTDRTTDTVPTDASDASDAELDAAGGALATVGSVVMFAFMVVFAVGCGLLRWFG